MLAGIPGEAAAPACVDLPGRARGRVLGFGFAGHAEIALESRLGTLETITTNPGVLGSDVEVSLVANHGSERTGSSLTHTDDTRALANAFVLDPPPSTGYRSRSSPSTVRSCRSRAATWASRRSTTKLPSAP